MVDETVIIAATVSWPKTSSQRPEGLLLVTITEARSLRSEISRKNGFAPSANYAVELLRQARTTVAVPPWSLPNLGSAPRPGGEDALLTST